MTHRAALTALAAAGVAACSGGRSAYQVASPARSSQAPAYSSYGSSSAGPPGADQGGAIAGSTVAPDRPGLGTEFGEAVSSRVVETRFVRAADSPFATVALFYNDADGIRAQADYRGAALAPIEAETPAGGVSIGLTDGAGALLPGYSAGGRTYVVGQAGQRYAIVVENHTAGRYELVASVDGLDVIDGRAASYGKRGYILAPGATLVIDGFRTSDDAVAAFRFGAVSGSYAARTGDDRNVGVVGLALFAERGSVWTSDELARRESADPFPARYAVPPPL